MSRSLTRWQAVLLGLVCALALGFAGVGLFAVGNRQWLWSDTFTVTVGFEQIRGVEAGTRVRVQGIEAGEVAAVLPPGRPGEPVTLRLRLDGKLRPLIRADASAQIVGEGMIGGKVVEIDPGSAAAEPIRDDAVLASKKTVELNDVLGQVSSTVQGIRDGEGTLGKLARDPQAYDALVDLLTQGKGTMSSLQDNADAVKRLPGIRNYVEDAEALLVRPQCERNRKVFAEAELFAPGEAVLTAPGRQRLDDVARWVNGLKHEQSDVVIVAYADPKAASPAARRVTREQSNAVSTYLQDRHKVQKMGLLSFSRPVKALGMGAAPPPVPEKEDLPPARVEVVVFVPLR